MKAGGRGPKPGTDTDFHIGPRPAQTGWKVVEINGELHAAAVYETMQQTIDRMERGEPAPKCQPKPKVAQRPRPIVEREKKEETPMADKLCKCGGPAGHKGRHRGKDYKPKASTITAPLTMPPVQRTVLQGTSGVQVIDHEVVAHQWNEALPTLEEADRYIAVDPPEIHELAEASIAFYLNPKGNTEGDRVDFMKRSEELAERIRRHREIKSLVQKKLGAWLERAHASTEEEHGWPALWRAVHAAVTEAVASVEA